MEGGLAASPLVEHCILQHGGQKPQVSYTLDDIQPRALFRVVKEAIKIANLHEQVYRMGGPRVPILAVLSVDNLQGRKTPAGSVIGSKEPGEAILVDLPSKFF